LEELVATTANLTLDELESLVEQLIEKKFASAAKPPETWLPEFFETYGSFRETPLERESLTSTENRSELQ
jgi:hypothetical protein